MPVPTSFEELIQRLRVAGEPTRFRILAACATGELTVGELCAVLRQSQPRVSRHLRLLCDAGLLVRFREEHCVYYRAPLRGANAEAVRELLAHLRDGDPVVAADRARATKVRSERAAQAVAHLRRATPAAKRAVQTVVVGTPSDAMDAARASLQSALLEEIGADPVGELLDIGTGTGRILRWLAPRATQAIGIDLESQMLRIARTTVHAAGLSHCILRRGDMYALPYDDASFDTVAMDHVLGDAERPLAVLREAARLLKQGGRLIVIEDFDRLESLGARNSLETLRDWLLGAGVSCERLRPVDADGQHVILALGHRRDAVGVAA